MDHLHFRLPCWLWSSIWLCSLLCRSSWVFSFGSIARMANSSPPMRAMISAVLNDSLNIDAASVSALGDVLGLRRCIHHHAGRKWSYAQEPAFLRNDGDHKSV